MAVPTESLVQRLRAALGRTGSFGGSGAGPDIYEMVLGTNATDLTNQGRAAYPETPVGSAQHRLAAKLATQQLGGGLGGAALTQLGGLGVEGLEALGGGMQNPNWGADTANDLKANLQGSWDAFLERLRSAQ